LTPIAPYKSSGKGRSFLDGLANGSNDREQTVPSSPEEISGLAEAFV
jgi:hypothetical protein